MFLLDTEGADAVSLELSIVVGSGTFKFFCGFGDWSVGETGSLELSLFFMIGAEDAGTGIFELSLFFNCTDGVGTGVLAPF